MFVFGCYIGWDTSIKRLFFKQLELPVGDQLAYREASMIVGDANGYETRKRG